MWNHSAARLAQYLALATIINSPGQRPNGVSDLGFDPCLIVVFDNCCLPWEPRGWRWYPPCQVDECRTPLGRPKADFYWFLLPPGAHQKINEFRSLPETAWEVQKSTQGCPRTDFSSILRTSWCHSEKAKTFKNGVRIIKYQGFWPPKTVNFSKICWVFFCFFKKPPGPIFSRFYDDLWPQMSDALNPLYMSVTMGIDFRTVWFGFIKFWFEDICFHLWSMFFWFYIVFPRKYVLFWFV